MKQNFCEQDNKIEPKSNMLPLLMNESRGEVTLGVSPAAALEEKGQ